MYIIMWIGRTIAPNTIYIPPVMVCPYAVPHSCFFLVLDGCLPCAG
jgi:hypothetical protein